MAEINKPELPAPYIDHTILKAAATALAMAYTGADRIGASPGLSIIGKS